MALIDFTEILQAGQHWNRCGVAQAAQSRNPHIVRKINDGVHIPQGTFSITNVADQLIQPGAALSARGALPAGFV